MELVDSLKARFDNITGDAAGVAKWSQAFNNNDWPVSDTDKLEEWGHVDVMEMAEKYSKFLTTENEDAADMKEKAIEQWTDFKEIVAPYMKPGDGFKHNSAGVFHKLSQQLFWEKAAKRWWPSGAYTLVFKLVALTVLFPWDNPCCERGFSCMNRIKCRMRASLGPVLLDQLMRISMCGPPLDSWDPRPAIAKWMAKKDRRVK